VHEQCTAARFVAMDTMNFWIESTRGQLEATIASVDCLIVNDEEVKQLTDEPNLVRAARGLGTRLVLNERVRRAAIHTADRYLLTRNVTRLFVG
jgi:sugar/nucleoside kinase (ribokinase family)